MNLVNQSQITNPMLKPPNNISANAKHVVKVCFIKIAWVKIHQKFNNAKVSSFTVAIQFYSILCWSACSHGLVNLTLNSVYRDVEPLVIAWKILGLFPCITLNLQHHESHCYLKETVQIQNNQFKICNCVKLCYVNTVHIL